MPQPLNAALLLVTLWNEIQETERPLSELLAVRRNNILKISCSIEVVLALLYDVCTRSLNKFYTNMPYWLSVGASGIRTSFQPTGSAQLTKWIFSHFLSQRKVPIKQRGK